MHSEPMAEHIPGDHHVGFHTIHSQAVHAQELGQEGVAVALHNELHREGGRLRSLGRYRDGRGSPQAKTLPAQDAKLGSVKSWGSSDLQQAIATPTPKRPNRVRGWAGTAGPCAFILVDSTVGKSRIYALQHLWPEMAKPRAEGLQGPECALAVWGNRAAADCELPPTPLYAGFSAAMPGRPEGPLTASQVPQREARLP